MPEVPITPEMQEMLPKAVHEVTGMVLGDNLNNLLRGQSQEQRDGFWQDTAGEFPPFSERIAGLREALKRAEVTKRAYPEPVANVMTLHFVGTQDQMARSFLTDVLFARTITSPGYMDYEMDVVQEAEQMAKELGVQDGLRGEQMKKLTLDNAVGAALAGSLKLTRQTQLEGK